MMQRRRCSRPENKKLIDEEEVPDRRSNPDPLRTHVIISNGASVSNDPHAFLPFFATPSRRLNGTLGHIYEAEGRRQQSFREPHRRVAMKEEINCFFFFQTLFLVVQDFDKVLLFSRFTNSAIFPGSE
jgi:hypothetical protein